MPQVISISRPTGISTRLLGSLVFLAFFGAGLLFLVFIGREVFKRADTYRWPAVPCAIISSKVVTDTSSESPYRLAVHYSYKIGDKSYQGERAKLSPVRSGNYTEVSRLAQKYAPSSPQVCYVNPRNPNDAVLQRSSLWFALLLAFPLPFILIGGVGVVGMWKNGKTADAPIGARHSGSISALSSAANKRGCTGLLFGIFLVVGLVLTILFFVRPLVRIVRARDWPSQPCTIISSNVRSHRSDGNTTYSVDILYSYRVDGKEYRANRYAFMGGSSSGYSSKASVVAKYRPGRRWICYVNPNDPADAVLERGLTSNLWFGLIPMIFFAVGLGGVIHAVRRRPGKVVPGISAATVLKGPFPQSQSAPDQADGPVLLKPKLSPLAKFIGALFVALFWNGIISVFIYQAVKSWTRHRPEWALSLFLIPFVLIGLGLVVFALYSFAALFSPKVKLKVGAASLLPGATIPISWTTEGRVASVRSLRIYLEGREEAAYARGTTTATDKEVFSTTVLTDLRDSSKIAAGAAELTVPATAIHSFDAPHNKIIWALFVQADVANMPDVKDEFPIEVLPQPAAPPVTRIPNLKSL